jgi:fermentation-respiration switch protein FrsA (DUF1100 family)
MVVLLGPRQTMRVHHAGMTFLVGLFDEQLQVAHKTMILNKSKEAWLDKAVVLSGLPTRGRLWFALLLPAFFISSSLYALRWVEYAITFQPERYRPGAACVLPKGGEDVSFLNQDQQRLNGWFIRSQSQPASATIVFFHGQGGSIANVGWIGENLASLGFDVLLFDYRGYGRSEGEIASERDMYADADAAYDYAVNQLGTRPERVVLYGHSLGTAAVVDLASRRTCGAVVLESGLSSASDMAGIRLPWLPKWLRALGKNRFDSVSKLANVFCPVLVAHGEPDNVVPTEEGRALYAAAREPKRLIILPGADHSVSGYGGEKYFGEIAKFIRDSLIRRIVAWVPDDRV